MNNEVKAKWLAALRSGEYKQGHKQLATAENNETTYCCLGVLCDLAVKEGVIPKPWLGLYFKTVFYGHEGAASALPAEVKEWAGLERSNPFCGEVAQAYAQDGVGTVLGDVRLTLAELNDGSSLYITPVSPHTFEEIADIIEEVL
jgi:hypothetical protein